MIELLFFSNKYLETWQEKKDEYKHNHDHGICRYLRNQLEGPIQTSLVKPSAALAVDILSKFHLT